MRKKNICVTRLDKDKVAYLFFKIFIKQTKIVHLYSKRSSFINHSAVFAILFIVKFSDFTTQQHGRRLLAGVCRQLSARPPNIKGVSLLVRFPILCPGFLRFFPQFHFRPQTQSSAVPGTKIRKITKNPRNSQENRNLCGGERPVYIRPGGEGGNSPPTGKFMKPSELGQF